MILVTGAQGQLGSDVVSELKKREIDHIGIDIADLDITDYDAVYDYITDKKPESVIHCAAYTAVDNAEDEPELCYKVNAGGTENIAKTCSEINAELIYISTDYVFDGESTYEGRTTYEGGTPYEGEGRTPCEGGPPYKGGVPYEDKTPCEGGAPYETDSVKGPLSIYGKSKLAGEMAVLKHVPERHYIVRISWVFGHNGNNFVKTMLKLAQTRDEINVVDDQVGSPTYTPDLAALLCDMALSGKYGIYHATNEGFCSWAEFAAEIMRQTNSPCKINPIPTEQYPTKATRPKNSRLSKASLDEAGFARLPSWQDALERYLFQKEQ